MAWGREDSTLENLYFFFLLSLFSDFDFSPLLIVIYVRFSPVLSGCLCFGSTGGTGNGSHAAEIKLGSVLRNCCGKTAGNFEGETALYSYDVPFLIASSNHTS